MHTYSRRFSKADGLLLIALTFLLTGGACAQPSLIFKRIINDTSSSAHTMLFFKVHCQTEGQYPEWLTADNFEVYENGEKVEKLTAYITCPYTWARLSAALVFDCGERMSGAAIGDEINAGVSFVGEMDGGFDEACIFSVQKNAALVQTMTTSKTLLTDVIQNLSTGGVSAPWDACYLGIQDVVRCGTNQFRVVILISDGYDFTSRHTIEDLIALATQNRVRVCTIAIGNQAGHGELHKIADKTGGIFLASPTSEQVVKLFDDLTRVYRESFCEDMIDYQSKLCRDGGLRTVDLVVKNACNGTDRKTKSYYAARDTASFAKIDFRLGKGRTRAGSEIKIPLYIDTPFYNEYLPPSEFTIRIKNPQCGIQFKSVNTELGTLLDGVPVTATPMVNSITIRTTQKKLITGSGVLAELTFTTNDQTDTCCSEIEISSWSFDEGCLKPVLHSGEICIVPVLPVVQCAMTVPQVFTWNNSIKGYMPDFCTVTMQVKNLGDADAKNSRFRILYDASDFTLTAPASVVQYGVPSSLQGNGGCLSASWNLAPICRPYGRDAEVCVVASFDNHPDVKCCSTIRIPAANISSVINTSGPTQICDNGSVVLAAEPGYFAYSWNTGDTTSTITAMQSGRYYCIVQSRGGCVFMTDTITVVRRDAIDPSIKALGYTPICDGDSVLLDAGAGYVSYAWNTGETTRTISAKVRGLYSCYVEDSSHCGASTPAFQLDIEKLPMPVVIRNGNTLSTSVSAARYEWSRDGAVLLGETNASLLVTQTGSYVVTVYSAGGCRGVSAPFVVDVVMSAAGVPAAAFTMDVYPEPNNGQCTVCINLDAPGDVELSVCDMLGRTVYTQRACASTRELTHTIDLSGVPAGSYVLHAVSGSHSITKMLVKETR